MPNRFFTNVIDLLTGGKARATEVEANFTSIEVAFDTLATEYDATLAGLAGSKADTNGEAYTGTHDFTGASSVDVPTPAAGVTGSKAVNMTALLNALGGVVAADYVDVEVSTATYQAVNGQRILLTGALQQTITAPAYSDGGRWAFKVCNGRTDAVINWNSGKHQGLSDATMLLENQYATAEVLGVNATYGWGLF